MTGLHTATLVNLPLSKSIVNRILVLELVSGRNPTLLYSRLDPSLLCRDIVDLGNALEILWRQKICLANESTDKATVIISEGAAPLRFFIAAAASIAGSDITIKVTGRLAQRPISSLLDSLKAMGADILQTTNAEGYDLRIKGNRLSATDFELDTSQTSQFLSALMLVSPNIDGWENVKIPASTVSSPYVYMTARLLENRNSDLMRFVEADWSAAANFFLISLLFGKTVELASLHEDSLQGDSFISVVYKALGGMVTPTERGLLIDPRNIRNLSSEKEAQMFCMPLGETPDIVPPLAVGLALAGVRFRLMGVDHLRHKESDRIAVLIEEMGKIGISLSYSFGSLVWDGTQSCRQDLPLDPHGDHRMAMAFGLAEELGIASVVHKEVVDKSYPDFWNHFKSLMNPSVKRRCNPSRQN